METRVNNVNAKTVRPAYLNIVDFCSGVSAEKNEKRVCFSFFLVVFLVAAITVYDAVFGFSDCFSV